MTTLHDVGGVVGRPLDTFLLGSHKFHGHGSWLMCEVALSVSILVTFQGGLWVSYNYRRVWEWEAHLERE